MYNIDYKTTIWQRATFKDEESLNKAVDILTTQGIDSIFDSEIGFIENEILFDTSEYLEPSDNYDQATIEVFNDNTVIWSND